MVNDFVPYIYYLTSITYTQKNDYKYLF